MQPNFFETSDTINYHPSFSEQKIAYSEIALRPQFCIDEEGFFIDATGFFITGDNLKFLVALFNSTPFTFFFRKFYAGGGLGKNAIRYRKAEFKKCPIPILSLEEQQPFVELVEKIHAAKHNDQDADTSKLENQIDKLVYQLYKLNDQEVDFIENQQKTTILEPLSKND